MKKFFFLILVMTSFFLSAQAKKKAQFPSRPALKKGEFAVFIEDKYIVFKTGKFENLELDSNCLKSSPPRCQAYLAKNTPVKITPPHSELNHPAALNCQAKGGQNLIAFDSRSKEFDFCRFKDQSMVDSWSLYNLENPVQKIK